MIKKIFIISTLLLQFLALGQQEAQYTQYYENMMYYNPAFAGNNGNFNATLMHRQQWVGIKGAPMTQALSVHTPLPNYESFGIGLSALNDRVGPLNQTWINVDFSYKLRFDNHDGTLAMGLKGGVNLINGDLAGMQTTQVNDPAFQMAYQNDLLPNFGAGLYYDHERIFAGVSIPRLIQSRPSEAELFYVDQRHYYFVMGGYFDINDNVQFRPSTMLKITENAPFALDLTTTFIFNEKLWLGANYRLIESIGAFAQYKIGDSFRFGYAFDIATSAIIRHNFGTHEIMLTYDFNKNQSNRARIE